MQVCHFQHLLRQFDKNEPGRFLGEGVSFRAKLIGVLEVPEARGDRMCQEALADLKMAIRAAGEHKQRIQVHVAIDGLRLRDDKTGDSLYHHPVHKISFIAQDMTDSRAFGYIFGSPDTGHRFFGIKTDKAASQVVIAMRDLFQVVFELKKKEVELAKQQLEGRGSLSSFVRTITSVANEIKAKQNLLAASEAASSSSKPAVEEGGVAELVDLEQELVSLRRGLSQVEELTPPTDPFGDSFLDNHHQTVVLPPPPSRARPSAASPPAVSVTLVTHTTTAPQVTSSVTQVTSVTHITPSVPVTVTTVAAAVSLDPLADPLDSPQESRPSIGYDVFTELDPLGTGRVKPYVDKKLFFQELKNPPKKVLKDLVPSSNTTALLSEILSEKSDKSGLVPRTSAAAVIGASRTLYADPFADTDPFDSSDPFEDSFKDDPFANAVDKPKSNDDQYRYKTKPLSKEEKHSDVGTKSVFNGSLQVTLPPEPVAKSPRLTRHQWGESGSVRARPVPGLPAAPPLPPKNEGPAPPLPPPLRRTDRSPPGGVVGVGGVGGVSGVGGVVGVSGVSGSSSSDEYVQPAPPPLPAARRLDLSLTQLLTTDMEELSNRLRVPVATLSSMTLPQLTAYLRSYLAADTDRARIHIEPSDRARNIPEPKLAAPKKATSFAIEIAERPIRDEFEDNFTPPTTSKESSGTFVANFDDFDKKVNPLYDRYAAFREIQEEELKTKHVLTSDDQNSNKDDKQDTDEKEEFTSLGDFNLIPQDRSNKQLSHSPLKSLDELTLDSFNMFRNTASPKPMDSKIEDIKNVMKNLQLENSRRSVSPRDSSKRDDGSDRYAALREITITEPQDEFESLPPEVPKERKRSDERSDGFDNSDFFDCIDNSSLSFSHVDDAFRKSPAIREKIEEKELKVEKKSVEIRSPVKSRRLNPVVSAGSLSDVASASSPDNKVVGVEPSGAWSVLAGRGTPSSDSGDWPRGARRGGQGQHGQRGDRGQHNNRKKHHRQTSSSSRDMSWDEDPPTRKSTHSRHGSSGGSRECLDSGSGREKDKKREKRNSRERERDNSRDGRESVSTRDRDRRDSGSGRDRDRESRDSKDRDHRRNRRSRERDKNMWDRERDYCREREYRDSRSRDRTNVEYRDKERDRDRHRKQPPSWDEDDDDYSEAGGSGRSSPRDRWPEQRWRRDDRNYGSLGWRERRKSDRKEEDSGDRCSDRRYGATVSWSNRRSTSSVGSVGSVGSASRRDDRRRPRRDDRHRRRGRDPDNHYADDTTHNKRTNYSNLEGTRFTFEPEETTTSPISGNSNRVREGDSPAATCFRFDSNSISPRSMFEDDFTTISTNRGRAASIAEEDEDVAPLRNKPQTVTKDIKKSDSVNIFVRENDPFENDDFFACTGSDRVARRENWPGDFNAFDNS